MIGAGGEDEEEADLYRLLNDGLALYHAEKPFEAHEIWEYAWGAAIGRSKLVLQALILIAAALHKHEAGAVRGTSKLLAKAQAKLDEALVGASSWLGIDLVLLKAEVDRCLEQADRIAAGHGRTLDRPSLPRRAGSDGILYLHGFASGPTSKKASLIVPALRARGHHVAVPDLNEEDFFHFTISRALALARRHLRDRTLVIGSSLGAYVAALLAQTDERVRGMVLMAPAFAFSERMRARLGDAGLDAWRTAGGIEVEHYAWGRKDRIAFDLFRDAEGHPARPPIRAPTYILHGRRDELVPQAMVEEIAASHPGMIELDLVDDDHALVHHSDRALRATEKLIDRLSLAPDPEASDPGEVLARLERGSRKD